MCEMCEMSEMCILCTCVCLVSPLLNPCACLFCSLVSHFRFNSLSNSISLLLSPLYSNKGICDVHTGTCLCQPGFGGPACNRIGCPNKCSDLGLCMSMRETALTFNGYSLNRSTVYNNWDADQMYGCVCDVGFEGGDCSQKTCDMGDDPRTFGGIQVSLLACKGEFSKFQPCRRTYYIPTTSGCQLKHHA